MKIAIVGAGMGGLAAASLLADQGHAITLFDRFDRPKPVGSGLVIQPVGQAVLAQAGALDAAMAAGNKVTRMLGRKAGSEARVLDVKYDLNDFTAFGLAIHRAALFDALWQAMQRRSGIDVIPATPVTEATQTEQDIRLTAADGTPYGPFDLALDCAGAGSALSPLTARPLGYGAIWGTVDWPDTDLPKHHLSQRYRSASHMIGVLPIGRLPGDNRDKAAIFWSLPSDKHAAWIEQGPAAWRDAATDLWPAFAPFANQITETDQMTMARYSHGTMRQPYTGRLIHLGDAAHRASPQLGQGANMALLDAQAIARAIATTDPLKAGPAYARARRLHTRIYQAMSWAFTPMYQSDSRLLPLLRDRLLFPASQIQPIPRVLTSLVCGTMVPPMGKL